MVFRARVDAGRLLAARAERWRRERPVVAGVAHGGVVPAASVAALLHAPLDVVLVRKLTVPWRPGLALGAVAEGGVRVVNPELAEAVRPGEGWQQDAVARAEADLTEAQRRMRGGRAGPDVAGRMVIVVDDGAVTGATARAALEAVRRRGAARTVFAAPVASRAALELLAPQADEVLCLDAPAALASVDGSYHHFPAVAEEDVAEMLRAAAMAYGPIESDVELGVTGTTLRAQLAVPAGPLGAVLFSVPPTDAAGVGCEAIAERLREAGLATLLPGPATPTAGEYGVADVPRLAGWLASLAWWAGQQPALRDLPLGYLGAGPGAAAALEASTRPGPEMSAVVSVAGRPDLAGERLRFVHVPVLLVVPGGDRQALEANTRARHALYARTTLEVIPGATSLLGEPDAIKHASELAAEWFLANFE